MAKLWRKITERAGHIIARRAIPWFFLLGLVIPDGGKISGANIGSVI